MHPSEWVHKHALNVIVQSIVWNLKKIKFGEKKKKKKHRCSLSLCPFLSVCLPLLSRCELPRPAVPSLLRWTDA